MDSTWSETSASGEDSAALRELARHFEIIDRELAEAHSTEAALQSLVEIALARVPGAASTSITTVRGRSVSTVAATDDRAERADLLQYELGTGPCVDAALNDSAYHAPKIRTDERWPEFGRRVAEEHGVESMLAFRLSLEIEDLIGGLNIYGDQPAAFSPAAVSMGYLLAAHCALAISADARRDQIANLKKALESSREIGVAIGVVMTTHKVTREQAFALLSIASQHGNRKLRDLATEVADTGLLPMRPDALGPQVAT